ncbi:hypothetical protein N2152v2_000546 [Parachlorella kessleri]
MKASFSVALLLVFACLCASANGASTAQSRKMLQTGAVCCLIDNGDGSRAQCTQTEPNKQTGNNKQEGLVNVQGVFVNVGCIQIGTLIGKGYCLPGGGTVADSSLATAILGDVAAVQAAGILDTTVNTVQQLLNGVGGK